MRDQVDDDFDDRADLATVLKAEVTLLRARADAERQQWRSRMGLTTSTDEAVRIAVEDERKALREIVQQAWNDAAFGDGLDLSAIAHHVERVLTVLDARALRGEGEK